MSVYPTGIDTFTTKVDNVDDVMAADVNDLQDSVVAIQQTVGTGSTNFVNRAGDTMAGDLNFAAGIGVTADANFQVTASANTIVLGSSGVQLNDNVDNKLIHIDSNAITLADNAPGGSYLYLRNNNVEVEGGNGFVVNAITGNIALNTAQNIITSGDIIPRLTNVDNIGSQSNIFSGIHAYSIVTSYVKNNGADIAIEATGAYVMASSDQGLILSATGTTPNTYLSVENGGISINSNNTVIETLTSDSIIEVGSESIAMQVTGVTAGISVATSNTMQLSSPSGSITLNNSKVNIVHTHEVDIYSDTLVGAEVQNNFFYMSATGVGLTTSAFYGVPIILQSQNISGVRITSTNGNIQLRTGGEISTSGNITPVTSGVDYIGSVSNPFGIIRSNQYATSFVSGIGNTGTININWNSGTVQHLDFTGAVSGTGIISMTNGLAGSAYILTTKQNATGTIALSWSSDVIWQGGISGTMTTTSGTTDMFSFVYNGSKYLGSYSNNYF